MSVNDGAATSASQNQELERVNANSACFRLTWRQFSSIKRSPCLCLTNKGITATGCGVDWSVKLYPNGRKPKSHDDFIAVDVEYLTRLKGVIATFELSIINNVGEVVENCGEDLKWKLENMKLKTYVKRGVQSYRSNHRIFKLRRSEVEKPESCILKDDCLTISLDVTYSDPLVVPANEERLIEFRNRFEKLLVNDEFSDGTFDVGGKEIRAHKFILAMQSPVFKEKFLQEKEKNVFKIDDIEYAVLMELFRFMYTGEVGDIEKEAYDLLFVAGKFGVERLKLLCEKVLLGTMKMNNAVHCLAAADASNAANLKKKAYDFILNHADEIVERDEFTSLSPDLMRELFRGVLKMIPKKRN